MIDLLASVTPFNVPGMYDRPLTPEMVENARRSGITAVNATCSAGGLGAEAFIATVEREAGPRAIDAAWRGPEWLPTLDELGEPRSWLARVA